MSHTGFTSMIGTRRSSLASIFSFSPFCIGAEPPGRPPHLAPAHRESLPIHLALEMRYPTPFSIHFQSRHTRSNTGTSSEPEGYPASWPSSAAWHRGLVVQRGSVADCPPHMSGTTRKESTKAIAATLRISVNPLAILISGWIMSRTRA